MCFTAVAGGWLGVEVLVGVVALLSACLVRPMQPATPSDLVVHLLDMTSNNMRTNLTFNLIVKPGSVSHVTYEPSRGIRTGLILLEVLRSVF